MRSRASQLSNPRDLAAFHHHRAGVYGLVGELTAAPPTEARLRALRDRWRNEARAGAADRGEDLEDILEPGSGKVWNDEYEVLVSDPNTPISMVCKDAAAEVRHEASVVAALALDGRRPGEALVMAELARTTARYLGHGRVLEAALAAELQSKLLELHAGVCLGELGHQLSILEAAPRYARLGRSLVATLAEDQRLFGTAVGGKTSS